MVEMKIYSGKHQGIERSHGAHVILEFTWPFSGRHMVPCQGPTASPSHQLSGSVLFGVEDLQVF